MKKEKGERKKKKKTLPVFDLSGFTTLSSLGNCSLSGAGKERHPLISKVHQNSKTGYDNGSGSWNEK